MLLIPSIQMPFLQTVYIFILKTFLLYNRYPSSQINVYPPQSSISPYSSSTSPQRSLLIMLLLFPSIQMSSLLTVSVFILRTFLLYSRYPSSQIFFFSVTIRCPPCLLLLIFLLLLREHYCSWFYIRRILKTTKFLIL